MPSATPKQRIIGRTMTAVETVRVDSETNLRDILDKVHEISIDHIDDRHVFTPRGVIRAMVHTVAPRLGQTVYELCCGTGEFLAIADEHIARTLGAQARSTDIDQPNLWHGNPNAVTVVDDRTPAQIIESIQAHGRVMFQALEQLNALLTAEAGGPA